MKEKKVIDYTRTYRRIEADKKKCILYIVILLLLGFLLMWTQIDDLTRMICKICAGVLKKYEPHMYVGIRSDGFFFISVPRKRTSVNRYNVHSRRKMFTRANSIDFGKATFDDNI